jgi:hypothetical protein
MVYNVSMKSTLVVQATACAGTCFIDNVGYHKPFCQHYLPNELQPFLIMNKTEACPSHIHHQLACVPTILYCYQN